MSQLKRFTSKVFTVSQSGAGSKNPILPVLKYVNMNDLDLNLKKARERERKEEEEEEEEANRRISKSLKYTKTFDFWYFIERKRGRSSIILEEVPDGK